MSWIEQMTRRRLVRFLADVLLSAGISSVVSIFIWSLFEALGAGWGLLLLIPPFQQVYWLLVCAPFVLVPLYGAARGRPGFVMGPVLLGLAAYPLSTAALKKSDAEIAALTSEVAAPVRTNYAILAIDGGNAACDAICMKILITSSYIVALTHENVKDHLWYVYRVASGQSCFAPENVALAMNFLRTGYLGKCAVWETVADFGEGLVLRTRTVDKYHPAPELPRGFAGTVYELYERNSGRSRLLARRVAGTLAPPLPGPLMVFGRRPERLDVGPPIDKEQFLANALKLSVADLNKPPQPFPFDEVLDEIERYFGHKEIMGRDDLKRTVEEFAAYSWQDIVRGEGPGHTDQLQRRIKRLLASEEPIVLTAAVRALWTLDMEKQGFADDRLLELAFVAMSAGPASEIHSLLKYRLSRGRVAVSDEWRERARSRLNDPAVTPEQREILGLIAGQ
jgi:hypothetical protein